jgi:Sec-independent protein translocase protein TatA
MLPDVGLLELLVIAAVALLVLNPADVPVVMHKLGLAYVRVRSFVHGMVGGWLEEGEGAVKPPRKKG